MSRAYRVSFRCRSRSRDDRWLIGAVVAAAALLLLAGLGRTDLWAPDEPRTAAVAEELRSFRHGPGGLALLHLNDAAYTQKPPLYFWAAALFGTAHDRVTEVAARLPSALSGLACVALTAVFGARLFGRKAGALAGLLLATAFEFAHRARRAQFDVMLTLFELVALIAFWRLLAGSSRRKRDIALLHGAVGLAVLTKGPVGLLVPLLIALTVLALERRLRELPRWAPPWSLLLSFGPGLAWLAVLLTLAPGGTFAQAVGENLFGRFFLGTSHARPVFYYFYQFPFNFLPWTFVWPVVWHVARHRVFVGADHERQRRWVFLLAWVGVSFVFFSMSAGKRGLYLLPAFPATALLCADALVFSLGATRGLPRRLGNALLGVAIALPLLALAASIPGEVAGVRIPAGLGAGWAVVAAVALAAWRCAARNGRPGLARVGVVATAILAAELLLFTVGFPALDPQKSPRAVAQAVAARTRAGEMVGLAYKRSLLGGLHYYAERPVRVVDDSQTLQDFFARGGRVLVVPEKHVSRIRAVAPVETTARFRDGSRSLLVVERAPSNAPPRD